MASHIVYEDINGEYGLGKYGEFKVLIRKKDGYINAPKLCKAGGKRFDNWLANRESKLLITELEAVVGCSVKETIFGLSNNLRGTYVHQDLIPHIASWISPRFAIHISTILRRWRELSDQNEFEFWSTMGDSVVNHPSSSSQEEKEWQAQIAEQENGEMEVPVQGGRIDVLTDSKLIEVKRASDWKHALGQVLVYAQSYPDRVPYLYLFDCEDVDRTFIVSTCSRFGVVVTFN